MIHRMPTFSGLLLALSIATTAAGPARAEANDSPWGGDYFPNVPLVNQDGKTVRLYDDLLKDKKVLVDFVFERCEQSCPLDTAKMARVQKLFGDRVGRDIFIYSITMDPEHDTPAVLKDYAQRYGAGPGWQFLTGTKADIEAIRERFGERGKKEEHANAVKVGDVARGRWMRVPLTADANYIVAEVTNMFDPGWSAGKPLKSIAEAPQVEIFGPGQLLFANRCATCHGFDQDKQLGPDLAGITARRERSWLVKYIAAPNEMRARKDPIALELASRNKVLMPNLSLTNKELAEVIEYLEAKSKVAPPQAAVAVAGAAEAAGHDHHHHHHHGAAH